MSDADRDGSSPPPEGAPEWMCTFADLMSLLLCFFVLLLSFSEMDKAKYKEVAGSLEKAFGVQRKIKAMEMPKGATMIARDFDQELVPTHPREEFIASQIEKAITEELNRHRLTEVQGSAGNGQKNGGQPKTKQTGEAGPHEKAGAIQVEAGPGEVRIRIMGEASFDTGRADLRADILPVLARVAGVLNNTPGDIVVSGHTDNVPMIGGVYRSNLGLSMARSAAVADYLIAMAGIKPERIATMGFGEYRPIAANTSEQGRRRNRRVEITLKPAPLKAQGWGG